MGLFSKLKKKLNKTVLGKGLNRSLLVKGVNKTGAGKAVNGLLGLDEARRASVPSGPVAGRGVGFKDNEGMDFAALGGADPFPGGAEPSDMQVLAPDAGGPPQVVQPKPMIGRPGQFDATQTAWLESLSDEDRAKEIAAADAAHPRAGLPRRKPRRPAVIADEPAQGGPPSGPIMADQVLRGYDPLLATTGVFRKPSYDVRAVADAAPDAGLGSIARARKSRGPAVRSDASVAEKPAKKSKAKYAPRG